MKIGPLKLLVLGLAFLNIGASSPKDEIEEMADSVQASAQKNLAQDVIAKDDAQRAADLHLALRNTRWGNPTEIEEDPDYYYFKFETPENERMLIGKRTVLVDKFSKVAKIGSRR
jgi:hypothetical protein